MKTYYALVDAFINGAFCKAGDCLGELTDLQAKYMVLAGMISDEPPAATDEAPAADEAGAATDGKTKAKKSDPAPVVEEGKAAE